MKRIIVTIATSIVIFMSEKACPGILDRPESTIRVVYRDGTEEVIRTNAYFEYSGVYRGSYGKEGRTEDIKYVDNLVTCGAEDYQFAIFRDEGCSYSTEYNHTFPWGEGCRLIHGKKQINGNVYFKTIDDATIITRDELDLNRGVAVVKYQKDTIDNRTRKTLITPKEAKAVYFCDPGNEFKISFGGDELEALLGKEGNWPWWQEILAVIGFGISVILLSSLIVWVRAKLDGVTDRKNLERKLEEAEALAETLRRRAAKYKRKAKESEEASRQAAEFQKQAEEAEERVQELEEEAKVWKRRAENQKNVWAGTKEPQEGTVEWACWIFKINPDFPRRRIVRPFLEKRRKTLREEYHPDPYPDETTKRKVEEYFKSIDRAYEILMKEYGDTENEVEM